MRSVLSAGQGGGEGTGKSLVLQGGVEIREAEEHFVDEEENLEEGETLIRAIKAFDDRGVLLCAGALVRSNSSGACVGFHSKCSQRDESSPPSPSRERPGSTPRVAVSMPSARRRTVSSGKRFVVKISLMRRSCLTSASSAACCAMSCDDNFGVG